MSRLTSSEYSEIEGRLLKMVEQLVELRVQLESQNPLSSQEEDVLVDLERATKTLREITRNRIFS